MSRQALAQAVESLSRTIQGLEAACRAYEALIEGNQAHLHRSKRRQQLQQQYSKKKEAAAAAKRPRPSPLPPRPHWQSQLAHTSTTTPPMPTPRGTSIAALPLDDILKLARSMRAETEPEVDAHGTRAASAPVAVPALPDSASVSPPVAAPALPDSFVRLVAKVTRRKKALMAVGLDPLAPPVHAAVVEDHIPRDGYRPILAHAEQCVAYLREGDNASRRQTKQVEARRMRTAMRRNTSALVSFESARGELASRWLLSRVQQESVSKIRQSLRENRFHSPMDLVRLYGVAHALLSDASTPKTPIFIKTPTIS